MILTQIVSRSYCKTFHLISLGTFEYFTIMCITSMAITQYGWIQRIPENCKGSIKVFFVSMRHMLSKAVVLEAFSLMFDWHKTFLPKVWNFNVYISCLWSMFSRGIISMPWFALPFLFCLLNVFSNNSVRKKWKLRCKYCILKWRVWKLHIHARVVNIFGSGLKSVILF